MHILKAYADAGNTGSNNNNLNPVPPRKVERNSTQKDSGQKRSTRGDQVNISEAAMRMLRGESNVAPSIYAQDATYDQYGNMTRQFDSLQNDLRSLAGSLAFDNPGIAGKISALRSRLASLRAEI